MKNLRCLVYRQDGVFVAACPDLSLAAQADTPEEAAEKLQLQVNDFFSELNEQPEFSGQLSARKSPASLRLKYRLMRMKNIFTRGRNTELAEDARLNAIADKRMKNPRIVSVNLSDL